MWNQILKNPAKLDKITTTAFNTIDTNGDGSIQRQELEDIMRTAAADLGIEKPSKDEIKDVMKEMDTQGRGQLSKKDFTLLTEHVIKLINKNEQI